MIVYSCPECERTLLEADAGVAIKIRCKRCRTFVQAVPSEGTVQRRFYQCSECDRRQDVERPVNDPAHCMVCGTPTLVIIDEVRISERPSAAHADKTSGSVARNRSQSLPRVGA